MITNLCTRRWVKLCFALTALTVVVFGLFLERVLRQAREQREIIAPIKAGGGYVYYDWQGEHAEWLGPSTPLSRGDSHPPAPTWLRWLLGDDCFQSVVFIRPYGGVTDAMLESFKKLHKLRSIVIESNHRVTDKGWEHLGDLNTLEAIRVRRSDIHDQALSKLRQLQKLKLLWLQATPITDKGLEYIGELAGLEELRLDGTPVTDTGVKQIGKLTALQCLGLSYTTIDDQGLEQLRKLTLLRELDLEGTNITAGGLEHLKVLVQLHSLSLVKTQFTDEGEKMLAQALPDCVISR